MRSDRRHDPENGLQTHRIARGAAPEEPFESLYLPGRRGRHLPQANQTDARWAPRGLARGRRPSLAKRSSRLA